jgi:hypothetical protein
MNEKIRDADEQLTSMSNRSGYVVFPKSDTPLQLIGLKAKNLVSVSGSKVPSFFVISTKAFEKWKVAPKEQYLN